MALHTARYHDDPDCRAYQAELQRLDELCNVVGADSCWAEVSRENIARWEAGEAKARAERDARLAARGLAVSEDFDPQMGYLMDVYPVPAHAR